MRGIIVLRVLATVIVLLSVLFMPWWVSAILGFAAIIFFKYYIEGLVIFLFADALYGLPEAKFHNVFFIFFVTALIIFVVVELVRTKLRY